jgi:hypothetical protein
VTQKWPLVRFVIFRAPALAVDTNNESMTRYEFRAHSANNPTKSEPAALVAILRCPVVVVGKGFRASTVWASKRGKIGHPTLALKTDEHEWWAAFWANRLITGRQGIKKKVINSAHKTAPLAGTGMLRSSQLFG